MAGRTLQPRGRWEGQHERKGRRQREQNIEGLRGNEGQHISGRGEGGTDGG